MRARRGRALILEDGVTLASRWRELASKLGNNVDLAAFQSHKDY